MRKVFMLAVAATGLMVAACNTVDGAGKDISSAGNAVSNSTK